MSKFNTRTENSPLSKENKEHTTQSTVRDVTDGRDWFNVENSIYLYIYVFFLF